MIKIKDIKIANFRSFKNTENVLSKINKINVLVGKNNTGKTNVLRAVYMFFNPYIYNSKVDRNAVKQITGGATLEPKLHLTFSDNEIINDQINEYTIICDLNDILEIF
ncbi:MAG: AAA family ATPase [Clostridia bacterium]|nr:AAA family ATPase [Clostridia bacterium]